MLLRKKIKKKNLGAQIRKQDTNQRENTEGPLQDIFKSKEGRMLGMISPFAF